MPWAISVFAIRTQTAGASIGKIQKLVVASLLVPGEGCLELADLPVAVADGHRQRELAQVGQVRAESPRECVVDPQVVEERGVDPRRIDLVDEVLDRVVRQVDHDPPVTDQDIEAARSARDRRARRRDRDPARRSAEVPEDQPQTVPAHRAHHQVGRSRIESLVERAIHGHRELVGGRGEGGPGRLWIARERVEHADVVAGRGALAFEAAAAELLLDTTEQLLRLAWIVASNGRDGMCRKDVGLQLLASVHLLRELQDLGRRVGFTQPQVGKTLAVEMLGQ